MAIRNWPYLAQILCAMCLCGCLTYGPYHPIAGTPVAITDHGLPSYPLNYGNLPVSADNSNPVLSPPTASNPQVLTDGSTSPSLNSPPDSDTSTPQSNAAAQPDLNRIYGRTVQGDDRGRNPIIVIPGVLGSSLFDTQTRQVVWGQFGSGSIDPLSPWGARLIALPMGSGQKLNSLIDTIQPTGTIDAFDVRLLGIPFQIKAYHDLLMTLGVGGYRDEQSASGTGNGYSSFQFAYDWRRDNVENAKRLHQFILEKKAYVEAQRKNQYGGGADPVRFDIVAHSMGGLVARYYLEYGDADLPDDGSAPEVTWKGAENVERLIMIGTPNAGSLEALANLIQGETLSRFLPRYEAAILGTMPALYQLLPRSRQNPVVLEANRKPLDIMDPNVWAQMRWGLADPRQQGIVAELLDQVPDPRERQQIAFDHLTKCLQRAQSFHAAMDAPATPPSGTTIHLIAGDAHPTVAQFRVDNRGALTVTALQPGDSRVSRASALMDERYSSGVRWSPRLVSPIKWNSVNFFASDHLGLTSDPGFTDNILFLLLESPR
jgi:pimeloyl-ACP methyl ester carboxylesterase